MEQSAQPTAEQAAPKKRTWIWWVVGGVGAAFMMCIVVAVIGVFVLAKIGENVREIPTTSETVLYDPTANAQQQIDAALVQAKAENKLLLIDFGADWCPDCVVLSGLFESADVKPYLDAHYVVVRVDVGQWDNNLDVSEAYGNPIAKGIPAVVVVDGDNQIVATTKGGELANARTATSGDILAALQAWAK